MANTLRNAKRIRAARSWTTIAVLAALVVAMFLISMNSGHIRLSPSDVLRTLVGGGTDKEELILFQLRLPRIALSVMIGAGLAVSGCVLQGITRNPLADPGILGIQSGAGLMVVLTVALYPGLLGRSVFLLPVLALIGALATAALLYALARGKADGLSPARLALVGIALSSGISSAMIVLTKGLNPEQFQFVQSWLVGSITGTSWKFFWAPLPWLIACVLLVLLKTRSLNALQLGDALATGLGMRTEKERVLLLAAAVILAGCCVAVGGSIGFVGLVAPHLARQLVGSKHEALVPASGLTGALLVSAADTASRTTGMPTGIIVALIGAPYFLYLLARARRA